ncbi:MAG: hydantoinase/oxoprolinase family protein [Planctomycetota bacterium]|nr:hydantoinase/oxoprolinase family protein [Planctomycetota bacterium]
MPPYGLFDDGDIEHRPLTVIDGRMEIDGRELSPIDPAQVERAAVEMIQRHGVGAFAVTGYASHVNPAHELAVKDVLRRRTGMTVTCGHEVSEGLNYRIRAATAALNARIIPCLESFLAHVELSLGERGVRAPRMVVRSDGSLMNVATARSRPIETILSGPAASVAGARYLAGVNDAIVVDVGGTTTDTAIIAGGHVRTCLDGASVGGWRTHVKALDMRTLGLGGDSEIAIERGVRRIGPRRVGPICWLARRHGGLSRVLDWIEAHLDHYTVSTGGMDVLALNAVHEGLAPDADERRILDALADGPLSAHELAQRVDKIRWEFLPLGRLEETHTVQRCALTPTDLLHVTGQLAMWDAPAARRMAGLFGQLAGLDPEQFARALLEQFEKTLAVEVLKKQLDETVDADDLDRSPAAGAMVKNLLAGGSEGFHVRVKLTRPLVGIGAPAHLFLPAAAKLLETQAIVPPHADVANAVGAITSSVSVHRQAEISPNEVGRYKIEGLLNAPTFAELEQAYQYATAKLQEEVRLAARQAGTSERTVELTVADRVAGIADGSELFIGRRLDARVTGRPDIRLAGGE